MKILLRCLVAVIALVSIGSGVHAQEVQTNWVASVILPEAKPIEPARLEAALRKRLSIQDRFVRTESEEPKLILLRVAGGTAMVSLMDSPIPNQELQKVCQLAWYWQAACDTVRDHKAHFLVILMGAEMDKLDAALLQTKIVASVIEESNAVAAYWGVNLQPRDVFLKGSANMSRSQIPTILWINYRLSREQSGNFTISSRGLENFGLMEIEAKDAPMPGRELFDLILGTSYYLITKGPVIKDGDTIGASPKLGIHIRHADSYWGNSEKVYRIDFSKYQPRP